MVLENQSYENEERVILNSFADVFLWSEVQRYLLTCSTKKQILIQNNHFSCHDHSKESQKGSLKSYRYRGKYQEVIYIRNMSCFEGKQGDL